jgi:ligand-binding sensor domain-containing protein/two-component sensor histidine kinase
MSAASARCALLSPEVSRSTRVRGYRRFAARLGCAAAGLWLAAAGVSALNPATPIAQYGRDVWDGDSGLPQNSVDAILQTRDGYLWLGTQEGLVRFDGVRFTIFDSRNSRAMRDDWVKALCETPDGTLWVGTQAGLLRWKNGAFEERQPRGALSRAVVSSLFGSRDGAVWAATNQGLARVSGEEVRIFGKEDGLPGPFLGAIGEDSGGNLWVGSLGGLARFEVSRFTAPPGSGGLPAPAIALVTDPKGGFWIGTGKGLVRWNDGATRVYGAAEGLVSPRVQVLYRDHEGTLWVGTAGGLFRFDDGRFVALSRDGGGLSSNEVDAICEDREGSLWVGTRDGGLNRLKDERIANYTVRQGLSDDRIWSVFEDREGNIWSGSADGSLSRLAPEAAAFAFVANLGAPVRAIDQDTEGDLWVGTRGSGVYRLHGKQIQRYTSAEGLRGTWVPAICADRKGGVWIGTAGAGLHYFKDGQFTVYTEKDGLPSSGIFSLFQDRGGAVWIGTFGGGVSRFEDGKFVTFTTRDGLAHDIVMSIFEDAEGAFWFGTRGGLSRWKGGKFTTYRQKEGLFHDAVQKVLADDQGYLWLTSNHGIFRIRRADLDAAAGGHGRTLHPIGFTTANGMRSVECNGSQHGGVRSRDGRLWFATLKGLAMADPRRIRLNTVPPQVVIESVSAGLHRLSSEKGLDLPPAMRDLEFQYSALSFRNPTALRFKYQLEGFDAGWIDAGARRVAYYTNLPPGRFRFRVEACNEDGVWSSGGVVLPVTLRKSIPETGGFRVLCVLVAAAAAWGLHRVRVRRLAAHEALRTAVVEARLSALQAQLQPHFLFNALNSLLPLVGREPGRARRMIVRIADLLRSSLMSETRQLVTLQQDLTILEQYLEVERMRFHDRIQIAIDADELARSADVPSFMLQPLVENAIKHAADPRTGRVRIAVLARAQGSKLSLSIRDDGPGFGENTATASKGIGLRNIRRRLETLYPGKHVFDLGHPADGGGEVIIQIPLSHETAASLDAEYGFGGKLRVER